MRKLSTNVVILFGGDIAARLLGMVATIHLARVLDPEGYGMTVISTAVLSYALWFADLGLMTIGTREMARPPEQRQFRFGDFLMIRLVLATLVFVVVQSFIHLIYSGPILTVVRLYLLSLFSYALLTEWYFQGIREYRSILIWKVVSGLVYAGLLFAGVHTTQDVQWVPVYFFIAILAAAIVLLFLRRREDRLLPSRGDWRRYRQLLTQMSSVGVGGILAQGVQLLPPLALGYFASTADAGVLGAVLKIVFLALVLDRVFIALFLPIVSRLWASDRERLEPAMASILRIVIIVAFSAATVVALFAPALLQIIYGDAYTRGALALSILAGFVTATLINTPISYTLIAIGEERRYFQANVIGGIISIVAILVLTALLGLIGAALGMVISEFCFVGAMYLEFRKHFRVPIVRPLIIGLGLTGLMTGLGTILHVGAIWQAPLVLALFLGISYLLGGINRREVTLLLGR
jgi:O-antigen/teichoic acid export membrane protein